MQARNWIFKSSKLSLMMTRSSAYRSPKGQLIRHSQEGGRETETEIETERQRQRQTDRQRQRETEIERDKERQRQRERERETETESFHQNSKN